MRALLPGLLTFFAIAGIYTSDSVAQTPAAPPASAPADDDSIICNHIRPKDSTVEEIRCGNAITDGKILLFAHGTKPVIDLPIRNDRSQFVPADCTLVLTDREGRLLDRKSSSLSLVAGAATKLPYTLDTKALKNGVYSLTLCVNSGGKLLAQREYYVGVTTDTVIPKSADGGFLYGLDPNFGSVLPLEPQAPPAPGRRGQQGQAGLLPWIDAMGVDILRCAGIQFGYDPKGIRPFPNENTTHTMDVMRQHCLRVVGMIGPLSINYNAPNGFADEDVKAWAAQAEKAVRQLPDITYWELGNEPDLGYSMMDLYVRTFEETSRAVKRGNPKALVMNGGITFFGAVGPGNSRRFLQLVKPECIDVIAYHAHGFGSKAERNVYEQAQKAAAKYGKGDKPFADTESGMFVGSKKQEDAQAWMVAEKQTYAQSVGLKFLMTFRLHAFRSETGWGLIRSDAEPNPAIIAYRALTEHLKGLAFQKTLPLSQSNAEGYSFAQPKGPQRACIVWSNEPAFYNAYLKVAASAKDAGNPRLMDVYGNTSPAEVSEDGVVRVEVTQAPVYFLWDAADPQFEASVTQSMMHLPDMATIVPNGSSPLKIEIENRSNADVDATLSASITASGKASVTPEKQTITVPAHKIVPVSLSVQWTPSRQNDEVRWPASWLAFTDLQESDVNLAETTALPAAIKGAAGRSVQPVNNSIALLRPGEAPREKRPGFVFATVHSDINQVIRIGCAADFWMEFFVNGKVVCSTMEKGNGSTNANERIIELPLKKGENLLAVKVLSGKGGWGLSVIPPSQLSAILDPGKATNCIDLSLEAGGKVLARERLACRPVRSIALLENVKWSGPKEEWMKLTPDFILENANVTNLYDKAQDRSRWWQGGSDLSGTAWIRSDDRRVYLTVLVADDKDVTGTDPEKMGEFDSLEVGISNAANADGKPSVNLYTIGRANGKAVIYKGLSSCGAGNGMVDPASAEISASIEWGATSTLYQICLDRSGIGSGVFSLNFLVNDNDDGYRKQYMQWTGGLGEARNPNLWQQFIPARQNK